MKKRKSHKKRRSHNFLGLNRSITIIILALTFVLFSITVLVVSYNFGYEEASDQQTHEVYRIKEENKILRQRLKYTLSEGQKEYKHSVDEDKKLYQIIKKKEQLTQKEELPKIPEKKIETVIPSITTTPVSHKPKLALIFDDVSFPSQVRAIKAIGIKANLSFFPPTKAHPQTAQLARKEPFYMVHLPLEAMNFSAEEPKTLRVSDTQETMKNRLIEIKKDFPRLRYVNNHTGSKFTADKEAVEKLFDAARTLKIDIVDSRTTAETTLPEVYTENGRTLLARDVFLDHEANVDYICGQLKIAVETAQRNGKAIAIGHPRFMTLKAITKCKETLNPVELVYIFQL